MYLLLDHREFHSKQYKICAYQCMSSAWYLQIQTFRWTSFGVHLRNTFSSWITLLKIEDLDRFFAAASGWTFPTFGTEFLNAGKGYNSEMFRKLIHTHGVHANIPRKRNTKTNNGHMDWLIYQAKHVVENTFARSMHQRAISSRYDKLLNSYIGTVSLACSLIGWNYKCSLDPSILWFL